MLYIFKYKQMKSTQDEFRGLACEVYQQGPVYVCVRVDTCSRLYFIQQNENKIEHGYMVHLSWKNCYTIPAQFKKNNKTSS